MICAKQSSLSTSRERDSVISLAFPHTSQAEEICMSWSCMIMIAMQSWLNPKKRQAATICNDFLNMYKVLKARGSDPKVYIIDNKFYSDLKEAMEKYEIDFQLAPPHTHRINVEK